MSHTQPKKTLQQKSIPKSEGVFIFRRPKLPRKMFKKRSHLLRKVSSLLKVPILISRMKKPIIPRIISLKKSRKMKKFMLLRHYNYGHVKEYQFSPSNSPLIQYYYGKPVKKKSYGDLYSLLFGGKCLGMIRDKRERRRSYSYSYPLEVKVLPSTEDTLAREFSEASDFSGEDDSIDERAEKFIERFYEEMRMQRQDSFLSASALMLDIDN